ncbi:unnamed protein product [Rhizopus stolonifer]
MIVVTREQALSIFYYDLENVKICYYDDPKRPSLQCTKTIYSRPFEIHTYKSEKEADKGKKPKKNTNLYITTKNLPVIADFHCYCFHR